MDYVFEIIDKTGRKIRLTKKQWKHITKAHKYMSNYLEEIKETLEHPLKTTESIDDEDVRYYFKYLKHLQSSKKYIMVAVKYLNGEGFVITTYLEKNIR